MFFIGFVSLFIIFVLYYVYCCIRFYVQTKKNNATIFIDKYYVFVNTILIGLYSIRAFYRLFETSTIGNIYMGVIYSPYFYILLVTMFVINLWSLRELFSYNESNLICFKKIFDIQTLKLKDIKELGFEKLKVTLISDNKKIKLFIKRNNWYKLKAYMQNN